MRILFFSHYFPPESNAPANRTFANCRSWVKAGHQVTVITCAPNCPNGQVYPGYSNQRIQREYMDGIEVVRVWTLVAANQGTFRRSLNYLSYLLSATIASLGQPHPDLIIATSPQFFCGWAGIISSWLRYTPVILEIRDIWPDSIIAVEALNDSCFIRCLAWLEKRMYRAANLIVTVGKGYRDVLIKKGVPEEKITVIPNGIDRELFSPLTPDPAIKERYKIKKRFVCTYAGTIGMACGLETVIEAAELLHRKKRKDIVFLLVGDGAIRKYLETLAKAKKLDNVIFTGQVRRSEVGKLLAVSDAFLVHLRKNPLFTTVMPSKIFEAAGMALPIICGVDGQAASLIDSAKAGINIPPENTEKLIEACAWLADHKAERIKMGKQGHNYISKNFDRENLAEEYLEIIKCVAGKQ